MIRFNHVSKEYQIGSKRFETLKDLFAFKKKNNKRSQFIAVDDVSFHVPPGTHLGVLGCNGAGKSTLLKLLTRIILPSSGEIVVRGSISCLLEVGAGFHHELSGRENIFLSGAILGMSNQEVSEKLQDIIEFSEITSFINEPVKYYSSGMYLRLAFSVGVHLNSDILVIDEALSVGDSKFQQKCIDKINSLQKQNKTLFFVSHDIEQVRHICDRVLLLDKGKLVFDGDVEAGIAAYQQQLKN